MDGFVKWMSRNLTGSDSVSVILIVGTLLLLSLYSADWAWSTMHATDVYVGDSTVQIEIDEL